MDLVDLVDLVDLKKRWIWTFAPNPPPRLYKTRKVDLDSVTEKLAKTLEVDLVDLDFKFAKTSKVDLKGFEHRCDIWRSRHAVPPRWYDRFILMVGCFFLRFSILQDSFVDFL